MDGSKPTSQQAKDVAYALHPYADARLQEKSGPLVIVRGRGVYVYDEEGKEYIEGLAGLWCVALGFSEPRLVDAAVRQLNELPFYHLFGNKSHRPSIELSEKLVALARGRLRRVFFTNSGSEANDTVVKFIRYFNNARGRPAKKKIISRQRAYHGVTTLSASLCGLPINHRDFDVPVPNVLHTSCPHYWRFGKPGETEEAFSHRMVRELGELIQREGADTIAAFIGEPINGAGGVISPPAGYWKSVEAVCRRHDILFVVDEVITGFGRTGRMFASELYGIEPDVMVLSKQLTSAYQPLAAILMSDELYQGIADNTAKIGALGHGFTSGGNPVSTAVALENIRVIEERGLVNRVNEIGPRLQEGLRRLGSHPLVGEVRGLGLIAGVELVAHRETRRPFDPIGRVGAQVAKHCQEYGLIVRAIGDTIAFCPPLIVNEQQIDAIVDRFSRALDETLVALEEGAA